MAKAIIDDGGYAFSTPADEKAGWDAELGMTVREYYAAHCPMTMSEAYEIWVGSRRYTGPGDPIEHDSLMAIGLRSGAERLGFFEWWSLMRFEYADAMIAQSKGGA